MRIKHAAVMAVLCAAPLVSSAGDDTETATTAQDVTVDVAGVQVAIDPVTGRLRPPTEAEAAALAAQFRSRFVRTRAAEPAEYHANGMVTKRLGTEHLNFTMAHIDASGELDTVCIAGAEAAASHLEHQHDADTAADAGERDAQ